MRFLQSKQAIREHYRRIRTKIGLERRKKASLEAKNRLMDEVDSHPFVLSYASFGDELEMGPINRYLAQSGKLLLPKVVGDALHCFHVRDLDNELIVNSWSIPEPVEGCCEQVSIDQISCILVPGLAFDEYHHRIGYGKGFYDRLLAQLEKSVPSFGLGFREQFCAVPLPKEKTDIPVNRLLLL